MSTGMRMQMRSLAKVRATGGRYEERLHPPLQGEGRTAEGSPGWGWLRNRDTGFAAPPSPPPAAQGARQPPPSRGR
jgi:hypothetical protein